MGLYADRYRKHTERCSQTVQTRIFNSTGIKNLPLLFQKLMLRLGCSGVIWVGEGGG